MCDVIAVSATPYISVLSLSEYGGFLSLLVFWLSLLLGLFVSLLFCFFLFPGEAS